MSRQEHIVKMDLRDEIVWILVHLSQKSNQWGGAVNNVMCICILNQKGLLTSWTAISFPQRALLYGVSILFLSFSTQAFKFECAGGEGVAESKLDHQFTGYCESYKICFFFFPPL